MSWAERLEALNKAAKKEDDFNAGRTTVATAWALMLLCWTGQLTGPKVVLIAMSSMVVKMLLIIPQMRWWKRELARIDAEFPRPGGAS